MSCGIKPDKPEQNPPCSQPADLSTLPCGSEDVCGSPFVQQLQFDASGRHHPPEATVVAVDGQREALVVFWWEENARGNVCMECC